MTANLGDTGTDYRAATDRINSTAAWLSAAFGAIAALVVTTIGLSHDSHDTILEIIARIVAGSAALVCAVAIVDSMGSVFLANYVTLSDLSRDLREATEEADRGQNEPVQNIRLSVRRWFGLRDFPGVGSGALPLAGLPHSQLDRLVTADRLARLNQERLTHEILRRRPVLTQLGHVGPELFGHVAVSLDQLYGRLDDIAVRFRDGMSSADEPKRAALADELQWVRGAVQGVLAAANYYEAQRRFSLARHRLLTLAPAVAAALAIVLLMP